MVTAEFNPFAPGFLADPYSQYRALLAQNGISYNSIMEGWVLARYEDVDTVLTHPAMSADRRQARTRFAEMLNQQQQNFGPFNLAQTMLTTDPPEHTRLRKLVSKAFTPRSVENLRPRIQDIVNHLLDDAQGRGRMDLVTDVACPLPVIVIAEMLGVSPEDRGSFKTWSDEVVATLGGPFVPPDVLVRARTAIDGLAAYLMPIIKDRRENPRDDLISALAAAEEQGQMLTTDDIFSTAVLLLIAGNETTTHLIDNGVHALLSSPHQWRLLKENPSKINAAVEELLRFTSPVQGTGRVLKENVIIGGQEMKEGELAFALIGSANRDPVKWGPTADELDITRNPSDHVAFGDGIHFCLGAPLARAEAQIAIGTLAQRFPDVRADVEQPDWGGTFIIRGIKSLPLSW